MRDGADMAAVAERTEEAVGIMGVSRASFGVPTCRIERGGSSRIPSLAYRVPWLPAPPAAGEHKLTPGSSTMSACLAGWHWPP